MPSYSGVWTLTAVYQAVGSGNWTNNFLYGDIGLFGGGDSASRTNVIQYIAITTTGNAVDFGDLINPESFMATCASTTRGVWAGGIDNGNVIDYVTIGTKGNAIDFGDLTVSRYGFGGCNSSTRGLFGGGGFSASAVIDYITIATTGNATSFGNLTVSRYGPASCSSPTRGVWAGGYSGGTFYNVMDYVTIASTGNATDFGDLVTTLFGVVGCSSSTRGLFAGGQETGSGSSVVNIIQYITIASTGNATDFGDLVGGQYRMAACSNATRGVFAGGDLGSTTGPTTNVIQYVTIGTTGNTTDFGDLVAATTGTGGLSNANGGTQ